MGTKQRAFSLEKALVDCENPSGGLRYYATFFLALDPAVTEIRLRLSRLIIKPHWRHSEYSPYMSLFLCISPWHRGHPLKFTMSLTSIRHSPMPLRVR